IHVFPSSADFFKLMISVFPLRLYKYCRPITEDNINFCHGATIFFKFSCRNEHKMSEKQIPAENLFPSERASRDSHLSLPANGQNDLSDFYAFCLSFILKELRVSFFLCLWRLD